MVRPITPPPIIETAVPNKDTPPLVPGGTVFSVVIRIGRDLDRIPSSEARVSPRQHPNWPRVTRSRKRLQPSPN